MIWNTVKGFAFLWVIPYPLFALLTGEFDFREWNLFVRVVYFLYCVFWVVVAFIRMVEIAEFDKQKKKEEENKKHE